MNFIKNQVRCEVDNELKRELKELIGLHKNLKPQILKSLKSNDDLDLRKYQEISNSYLKITQYVKNVFDRGDVDVAEQLLRPLQDCTKIKHCIDNGYGIEEIKLLDNKEAIHAEYNITQYFPLADEVDYIGTSKLCCAHCHKYLEKKGYIHRGTHGVADQAWKMYLNSPQAEVFKESVLKNAIDLEEGQEVFQYRRLSTDEFEDKIEISLKSLEDNKYNEFDRYILISHLSLLFEINNKQKMLYTHNKTTLKQLKQLDNHSEQIDHNQLHNFDYDNHHPALLGQDHNETI